MSKIGSGGGRAGNAQQTNANPPPARREGDQIVEVRRGDTMSGIARQHNISLTQLTDANPQVRDANRIWPGDQLRLPQTAVQTVTQTAGQTAAQITGQTAAQTSTTTITAQVPGDQFDRSAQTALRSQELTGALPQAGLGAQVRVGTAQEAPVGTTTAGQLAAGASAAGGPLEAITRLAQESADVVRGFANTAQGRAAQVFAQGGEDALQATRAHQAAARLETAAAQTSRTASRLRTAGTVLNVAAGGLTAIDQYQRSHAQSTAGRAASSTGAGSLAVAVGARHPYFAAADAVAQLVGAPDTPSNVINRSVDTIATVGEGLLTGNTRGMESLQQSNLRGDNGPIFQAAAEAGDFWADHGVTGGLGMFGDALGDAAGDLLDSIF